MSQKETNSANEREPDELDCKIVQILLESPAITDQELANRVGCSPRTISRRRNSESVRTLVTDSVKLTSHELRRLFLKALKKTEQHLDHYDARVSLVAANQIFKLAEAALTSVVEKSESESEHTVYIARWGRTDEPGDF